MNKTTVERLVEAQLNLAGVLDPEAINQLMEAHYNECLARQARHGSPHRVFDADPSASLRALKKMGFQFSHAETAAHIKLFETAHRPKSLSKI